VYIRRCVTFAAFKCLEARGYRIGNKRSTLLVQSSLMLNGLQHKSVGRFVSRFGCRYDASF